ncbi:MAG TPA: NAD(P)-binding domain-containing protein, partial [Candidatus Dormibacteraeota bacterium]|nr:NAD(P)-binding domain-containing protein [Candidatus Dormibacteraeota bacterium]
VLTTCHRAELYGLGAPPHMPGARVRKGPAAATHLLRVAAGLESAIVGEDEVLHQVRDALHRAQRSRHLDFRLLRLFEIAIATGRRARSGRTESSSNLAQSAVAWLGSKSHLTGRVVVVAGAGRMGAALAHSLADAGASITVASRHQGHASRLAAVYTGHSVSLEEGAALTRKAAAVAVALGGPWFELSAVASHDLPPIADISAPQAVPDEVRSRLDGSFLGIDDLYHRPVALPGAYIKDAETLVERNTAQYVAWLGRVR